MITAVSIMINDGLNLFTDKDIETLAAFAQVTHVPTNPEAVVVTPGLLKPGEQCDDMLTFTVFTPIPTQKPIPEELTCELERAVASDHDPAINRAVDAITQWKREQPSEPGVIVFDETLEGTTFPTAAEAVAHIKAEWEKVPIKNHPLMNPSWLFQGQASSL